MKKTIVCLIVGLLLMANMASAQVDYQTTIGADVHLGSVRFNHLFNNDDEGTDISLWELVINGKLKPTPDLMLLINHTLASATNTNNDTFAEGTSLSSNYTQAALLYQFYNDEPLSIYAGLGYHFANNHFRHLIEQNGQLLENVYLEGSGFMAASQVTFHVLDNLEIKATIQAAPFYSWTYRVGDTIKDTGGSAYQYLVAADYDFNERLVIRVGYGGSRSAVKEIPVSEAFKINKTTFTQGGLQVGVIYKF